MNRIINFRSPLIIFGILAITFGFIIMIARSPVFRLNPDNLAIGITADLLLTVPLLYFFLIRKTGIPKTTVIPVLILGLIIGTNILPSENQQYLDLFKKWAIPVIELSVLSFVIYKVSGVVRQYKLPRTQSFDFFTTLKEVCYKMLPGKVVMPVVTEIAVFYYGFLHWKKIQLKENEFSYHKASGTVALLGVTIFMIGIETAVFHLLLTKWSNTVAWMLTFLSLYSAIQIFGFLRSMYKRPISVENGRLYLRYGIMNEAVVSLKEIDSVEISSKDIEKNNECRKLSVLGAMESHNVIIRLNKESTLVGLYGIKRPFKVLALYVDDKYKFEDKINKALSRNT